MKKQLLTVVCSLALLVSVGACKNKQEQTAMPPGHPATGQTGMPAGKVVMPKGQTTVNLPDSVKGKWKAVVIAVEDKATKKTSEHTIALNSDYKIPNTDLKISVGEFIPDFKMEGLTITSLSNDPNNPAVKVNVSEDGKEVFKGWLYSKFPTIHAFESTKYGLTLKSGVKKG